MIAFITSLIHPLNCQSYERIGALLDRTLRSVCRQTRDDFVVLVVCNQPPPVRFTDPRIVFVQVGFPPAAPEKGLIAGGERTRRDKGAKFAAGLLRAKSFDPDYVMFFDADDLVHRDIAQFVHGHPGADGWAVHTGYVYWEGSSRITMVHDFPRICGTSYILAYRLFDCPATVTPESSYEEILNAFGPAFVEKTLGTHRFILDHFRAQGCSIRPLPFPGAIWIRGTGENITLPRGFPSLLGTKISPEIQRDFGLEPPDTSCFRELAASVRQVSLSWKHAVNTGGVREAMSRVVLMAPRHLLNRALGRPRGF